MNRSILVVFALVSSVGVALAGEMGSKQSSEERFHKLDQDGNGYISHDEAQNRHRVFWYYQRADQNSDGAVDQSEFSAFEEQVPDTEMTPTERPQQ